MGTTDSQSPSKTQQARIPIRIESRISLRCGCGEQSQHNQQRHHGTSKRRRERVSQLPVLDQMPLASYPLVHVTKNMSAQIVEYV